MRRALLPLASAVLWLLSAGAARAELPALSWRAPVGCPRAAEVEAALARSADPRAPSAVRSVRARVESTYDGYSMELVLETAERVHQKQLSAKLCSTFVELLLLELSFASVPAAQGTEAADAPLAIRWGLRSSATLATAPLPWPAPGVALALGASMPWLRIELAGSHGFARTVRYRGLSEVGAEFQSVAGELRACFVLPARRVSVPLCLGVEAGTVRGQGFGVAQPDSAWRAWSALFLAPALHFPIAGPISGWLELGGAVAAYRPRFGLVNLPTLYSPDLLSARAALGVVLSFD